MPKKPSKKPEVENTVPLAWVEDQGSITTEKPKKMT